jgi:hypothetical protein
VAPAQVTNVRGHSPEDDLIATLDIKTGSCPSLHPVVKMMFFSYLNEVEVISREEKD